MNDTTYQLPELPWPPANMPGWEDATARSSQLIMDNVYLNERKRYFDQSANFLVTEAMKRGSNRAYVAGTFPLEIPRRQIVAFDANMEPVENVYASVDPNIHPPVLADLPPEQTGGETFGGPHPPPDLAKLLSSLGGALMDKLNAILAAVQGK